MELGLPDWTVNTCAMGHAMLTLHQWTGDERYKAIAEQKIDYLRNRALRFGIMCSSIPCPPRTTSPSSAGPIR